MRGSRFCRTYSRSLLGQPLARSNIRSTGAFWRRQPTPPTIESLAKPRWTEAAAPANGRCKALRAIFGSQIVSGEERGPLNILSWVLVKAGEGVRKPGERVRTRVTAVSWSIEELWAEVMSVGIGVRRLLSARAVASILHAGNICIVDPLSY